MTGAVVALLAFVSAVAAYSASTTQSPSKGRGWSIVALGDSVPRGTNCDCTPYPDLTADALTDKAAHFVTASNDSVAGYTSSDVLHQLQSDVGVIDQVRAANAVEIQIGANDVSDSQPCGTNVVCYAPTIPRVKANLGAIVARLHALTAGRKVLVVFLDYWNVWLGGQYEAAQGSAYVSAAEQLTDEVNSAIRSTAAASGSAYVDVRAAFKGPNYVYDETHYLSNDGDHPNAAGQQQIATATQAVIERALHIY